MRAFLCMYFINIYCACEGACIHRPLVGDKVLNVEFTGYVSFDCCMNFSDHIIFNSQINLDIFERDDV